MSIKNRLCPLFLMIALNCGLGATNIVTLAWTDIQNFHSAIVNPPDGAVIIPAVTSMVYRVYFSTNLLTNTLWQPFTNVSATNPGTNDIKATFTAPPVTTFYTVTAIDPLGLESDFSNLTGVSRPSPVKTGIRLGP